MNENLLEGSKEFSVAGTSENVGVVIDESDRNARKSVRLLDDIRIGISISNGEDLAALGFSISHQDDAMVEFARHMLVYGATLVYGGDLRKGGYTELFAQLSFQYRSQGDGKRFYFVNYMVPAVVEAMTRSQRSELKKNRVDIVEVAAESFEMPDSVDPGVQAILRRSMNLSKMRREMIGKTDVRIFMGGKNVGFTGIVPGLIEEFLLAMESNIPTYLIGAFGGSTRHIIECIATSTPVIVASSPAYLSEDYQTLRRAYDLLPIPGKMSFDQINAHYRQFSLERLSERNGLNAEENRRLFETKHIPEIIFLVLKGLSNVFNLTK